LRSQLPELDEYSQGFDSLQPRIWANLFTGTVSKTVSKGVGAVLVLVGAVLACVANGIEFIWCGFELKTTDSDLRLQL
jgi:hypothetical protein